MTPPRSVESGVYDIVWTTPSVNSGGSMPCGGHDVGLAVWVEEGSIRFYVDRSGSFDENNLMLKLGRVVVELDPNPFVDSTSFEQRLDLHRGLVTITGVSDAAPTTTVSIWCESNNPAVHVEVDAAAPVSVRVGYQSWRFADRVVPDEQRLSTFSVRGQPNDIITYADTVERRGDDVVFFHQNNNDLNCFAQTVELEGLAHRITDLWDPQRDLIFGGVLRGVDFVPDGEDVGSYADVPHHGTNLRSAQPARTHHVVLALHSDRTEDSGRFVADAVQAADRAIREVEASRERTLEYWREFWRRSHVDIWPGDPRPHDPDWQVGRNYALFRYLLGCNAHGEHPTKFNGGLFTTDARFSVPEATQYGTTTPDFRVWGGGSATAQNQRLVYWPLLRSGDADLLAPQFEFYRKALGNATIRTREYWGHGGCSFCEQVENFGLPIGYEWGWDSPRDHEPGDHYVRQAFYDQTELARPWVRYHYSTQLEMCFMVLRAHRFGADARPYLPFIDACITFFDEHYRMRHWSVTGRELTTMGELVISPSTALETYKDATNPTDVVQGLRHVLAALLGSERDLIDDSTAERYERILSTVPSQSFREVDGVRVLAPAQSWSDIMNVELPQLYGVFPYPSYGVGRPDLQVALDTYAAPEDAPGQRDHISWHQDGIFAARLGLADEAQRVARLKLADGPLRFPAFWGPGHDWVPDHNWGGSGMVGVQEMLLQDVDGALHVLAGWPDGVDVDFRLHAERSTVVEVSYRGGVVTSCEVTPAERAHDVVLHKPRA